MRGTHAQIPAEKVCEPGPTTISEIKSSFLQYLISASNEDGIFEIVSKSTLGRVGTPIT